MPSSRVYTRYLYVLFQPTQSKTVAERKSSARDTQNQAENTDRAKPKYCVEHEGTIRFYDSQSECCPGLEAVGVYGTNFSCLRVYRIPEGERCNLEASKYGKYDVAKCIKGTLCAYAQFWHRNPICVANRDGRPSYPYPSGAD